MSYRSDFKRTKSTRCIQFTFLSDAFDMAREHRQNAIQSLIDTKHDICAVDIDFRLIEHVDYDNIA